MSLRWRRPVFPGDTLHVRGKIVDKTPSRSKPEIGSFRSEMTVSNQDDQPVMTFTSIVLIRKRPARLAVVAAVRAPLLPSRLAFRCASSAGRRAPSGAA